MSDFKFVVVDVDAGTALDARLAYAAAQQRQLREHFAPAWDGLGENASVRAELLVTPVAVGEIEIRLLKKPTQDGALGYHDRKPDGTPIIYVFVQLAESLGEVWTSVASHEVLEVAGDPRLHRCVEFDNGEIWDEEICDRVEQSNYKLDGVLLSNFNYPECFEPPDNKPAGTKYDHMGLTTQPNQILKGGYAQEFKLGKGWVQHGQMSSYRTQLAMFGVSRGSKRRARLGQKKNWLSRLLQRKA